MPGADQTHSWGAYHWGGHGVATPHSIRTPLLRFDLDDVRGWPVAHWSKGQDTDAVCGPCDEAPHGGEVAVVSVVFLPHAQRQMWVGGIVNTVPSDLSVWLLRLLPLDQHGAGAQHPCLDFEGWTWRSLLSCPGLDQLTGGTPANVIDCDDPELILWEGAEPTYAIAGCCHTIHLLELTLQGFGLVLDDIIWNGVGVAWIPGEGHAGSCCFSH